jgi:outer membrane lipoprotein-sorting protein
MSKLVLRTVCLALSVCLAASMARAETLDEVQKKIAEQSKKITAMSMKMKSVSEIRADGAVSKSTLDGTYEYMVDGTRTLSRTEAHTRVRNESAGANQEFENKSLSIADGEHVYILSEQAGQKYASKMKAFGQQTANWRDDLKEHYDFKLLPDETIDGKPCYVLELTPRKGAAAAGDDSRSRHYYQKDSCVLVKAIVFGADGKPTSTTTYSDIKINPSLSKDRFKFTPPPGVEVQDLSALQTPGAESPPAGGK